MDIPIELFSLFIGASIALGIFGFLRNPQIPALMAFGGIFILFASVMTDNIIMNSFADGSDITNYMNVLTSSTGITIRNDAGGSWIRGELVTNSASVLANKQVNCLTVQLSRNGSPDFDIPIIFGVFDSSANTKYEFGRMNVTETTSSIQFFKRCNMINSYTIVSTDRIGIMWNDGTSTNNIAIRLDNSNPFDGTNTQATAYNGSWTETSGTDYSMIIGFDSGGESITRDSFIFTELPKTMFALLGVIFMLSGALMVFREGGSI
jgi:hypothetical protein